MGEHALGWIPDIPDKRDRYAAMPPSGLKYPRAANMLEYEAPIGNQGQLGSCTAWASLGVVRNTEVEQRKSSPDPSALAQYYWTRVLQGTVNQDSGASIRNAIKSLVNNGYCDEELWPYNTRNFTKKPSDKAAADARNSKIVAYERVNQTKEAIQDQCIRKNPIVFGFTVYSSFDAVAKTGKMTMPKRGDRVQGGHAVTIVGYDEFGVLCRNSWGTAWGVQPDGAKSRGYFWMPWAFVLDADLAADFWTITMVP